MASILMHSFGRATERRQAAKVRASDSADRDFWSMIAWAVAGEERDRVGVGRDAPGHRQRAEGRTLLELGEAPAELARAAHGGPVDAAGQPAAHVADHQLQGAADGGVGPVALTERVDAGVHPEAVADGAVDHQDRTGEERRGQQPVHVELGVQEASRAVSTTAGTRGGSRPSRR
ncbi:MAG: hypothetical protein U5K30_11745 [Acidimicrobiales bacterium]|nr:hypothetical protein [Acidimicrobiales bacterium]